MSAIETKKILFIMGNGPSLREVMDNPDYLNLIRNNHSFGLNAAYRAYEKYDFYPTYFGCFDYIVNESHKKEFEKLILSDKPIQKFFLIGNAAKQRLYSEKVRNSDKFVNFNFINENKNAIPTKFEQYYNAGCSGANALQIGIMLGYKSIVLIGCDCNYVELQQVDKTTAGRLEVKETIQTNPNYWFDDYQQIGDKFNVPNAAIFHTPSWEKMSKICPKDVKITNCSPISTLEYFEKKDFSELL